jgi:hypothetical protein
VRVVDAVFAGGHTTLTLDVPDIEGLVTTEVTDPTAPQWRGMDVTVEIDESRLWHLGR